MERIQATVLAVVIAAVVLFGLGYVVDSSAVPAARDGRAGSMPTDDDGERRIALWSGVRESRRAPGGPTDDLPPAEERRRRRAAAAVAAGEGGDVLPGGPRGGGSFDGPRGALDADAAPGGVLSDKLIAARTGAVPRGGGAGSGSGGSNAPDGPLFDFVEDPDDDGPGDVLLSLPLDGDLDAENGGMPTNADGLVVDDDRVEFTEDAQLTFPAGGHVNGEMGTVSFELEPRWAGSDDTNNSLLQIREEHQWENSLAIVKNYGALRFIIRDGFGVESNVNVLIDEWQPNVRQVITATWTADEMVMYVNGAPVGRAQGPAGLTFAASTLIHIGSDYPGSSFRGAGGAIRNLTVYGRALGADEVR